MAADAPPPGAVLRAPGLILRVDRAGTVRAETSASGSSGSSGGSAGWLVEAGPLEVGTRDGAVPLGAPQVAVDADEVEVGRSGGGLRTLVRHAVEQAWTVRVVLVNDSDAELVLDRVRLPWRTAPGTVVTALAAGARAGYAVQVADGAGPVLVGRLRSGAQPGVDASGLLLGPLVLGAHHRWAAQWRWEVVPDARRAAGTGDLPWTTWLDLGQTVLLPGGPDVAVVADGLVVEVEEDRLDVGAPEPGTYVVELRGARGTTAFPLTWAPDLDDLVDEGAGAFLAGPTTPAGTSRLAGPAAGLVVQDALARRAVAGPEDLADALELAAGLLVEQLDEGTVTPDPLALAFLAREADRTGSGVLLDAATRGVLAVTVPAPGLALAALALTLARVRGGGQGTDVVDHLGRLLARSSAVDDAGLETALLLRRRDTAPDPSVLAGLRRLGAGLGAGLPGRTVPEVGLERVAYAATLLGLVDEPTGQQLRRRWGCSAAELARRAAAEARARLAGRRAGPDEARALAWLVLGRPPR